MVSACQKCHKYIYVCYTIPCARIRHSFLCLGFADSLDLALSFDHRFQNTVLFSFLVNLQGLLSSNKNVKFEIQSLTEKNVQELLTIIRE